jgi:hypothetical protein
VAPSLAVNESKPTSGWNLEIRTLGKDELQHKDAAYSSCILVKDIQ